MPKHVHKKYFFPCALPLDETILPHLASTVFEVAHQPMILLDSVGRIRSINRAFLHLMGRTESELLHGAFSSLLETEPAVFNQFFKNLMDEEKWQGLLRHRRSSGELFEATVSFFVINSSENTGVYLVGFYHPADHPPVLLDKQNHAHLDALTNLTTVALFLEKLDHSLILAKKRGEGLTVFYVDIHQMSAFNQTYGLTHGDYLIQKFSSALKQALPEEALLSRVGGDSFAFVLHNSSKQSETHQFIEDILTHVEQQTHFQTDLSLPILHIGAASFPTSSERAIELFELAKHSSDVARVHPQTHIVYHKKQKD